MIEVVLGLVVVGFLAVLVFGLATRRIAWRQQACCAPRTRPTTCACATPT